MSIHPGTVERPLYEGKLNRNRVVVVGKGEWQVIGQAKNQSVVFEFLKIIFAWLKRNEMGQLKWSAEGISCLGENEPND